MPIRMQFLSRPEIGLLRFKRSHIDGEPVLHIGLEQPFVSFISLLDWDHLDIRGDVVLPAEIEHLLGFGNAADHGTGEAAAAHNQPKSSHNEPLPRRAYHSNAAIAA